MTTTSTLHRPPPYCGDAEMALLGAALSSTHAIEATIDIVSPSDFYLSTHSEIWRAAVRLFDEGKNPDIITVKEFLGERADADYLGHLADATPAISNAIHYARLVKKSSVLRRLIEVGREVESLGYSQEDPEELIDQAEQYVYSLTSARHIDEQPLFDLAAKIIEDARSNEPPPMVKTGFRDLDEKTGGMHDQNMVVIGARPGIGKTALAMHVAIHVAGKFPVAFFSLEMGRGELVERALCSLSRVALRKVRMRSVDDAEVGRLSDALSRLPHNNLTVYDDPQVTMMSLRSRLRRKPAKLVIVDYLQLMKLGGRPESRYQEVSELSRQLKALAKENKCCVLALSQLNRESEGFMSDGKPKLSQLRESGAIEQDADMVWLMSWPKRKDEDQLAHIPGHEVIIDIAKNRHGPVGEVKLDWLPTYTRFEDQR